MLSLVYNHLKLRDVVNLIVWFATFIATEKFLASSGLFFIIGYDKIIAYDITLLHIGIATQCGPETQKKTTQLDFASHITEGFPEEGKSTYAC